MKSILKSFGFLVMAFGLMAAPLAQAGSKAEIDAGVKDALARFAKEVKGGQEFLNTAKGMLVFPKIYKGGFIVGVEGGEGALLSAGKTLDYYASGGASWGLQAGAQAKTVIIAFMTTEALDSFRKSSGWKVGVDGSVAMVDVGAGGIVDTKTIKDPVVGFVFGQKGLMANLTLEGSKYEKINPK
jgi:lipid-binding SYLF domain-containing protein